MPRGRKPPPIKKPTQSELITRFASRIEQTAPEWLDGFIERQKVLIERFHEKDEDGNYVLSAAEQNAIHKALTASESDMMRFAALREQHLQSKGLSAYANREGVTNNLTLNFAPGMTPEQRAYAERLFLASASGKEVPAPPLVLEAEARVA